MESSANRPVPHYSLDEDPSVPPQRFVAGTDPYYAELRSWFALDRRIEEDATDLGRAQAVCASVHGRWTHSNDDEPTSNDPLTILKEASQGRRFRCSQYALVLTGALNAFGIPSRVVAVMSADVETRPSGASHVVSEAWLPSLGKWVMLDAQENAILKAQGRPLSCAEVAVQLHDPGIEAEIPGLPVGWDPGLYLGVEGFGSNFFYLQTRVDQGPTPRRPADPTIMLVPLGAPEPRVFQGRFPLANVHYTRSLSAFYRPPG